MEMMANDTTLALMKMPQAENVGKFSGIPNEKRIDKASQDFEAVFVSEMMKPMFEGIKTDGMFGGGQAEEVFRSIMMQEYGKIIAQTDRVGIAPKIKNAMIQLQEAQTPKPQTEGATP